MADGVGGGPAGDVASSVLLRLVAAGARRALELDEVALLLGRANAALRERTVDHPPYDGMATTFTGLFASTSGGVVIAHAGDSRAYLLRGGGLARETRDDSFVQLLVDSGVVLPHEAPAHPQRNVITASLRGGEHDLVAFTERDARVGDRWLLCSDGVTDYLADEELCRALSVPAARESAEMIVDLATAAGSRDDITAVVCDVVEEPDGGSEASFHGSASDDAEPDELWRLRSA